MFSPSSRYARIERATYVRGDGTPISYVKRRWLPVDAPHGVYGSTRVLPEERVDQLAARTLRDPLQFWRLCDANTVLDPFELVDERGRSVRVPLSLVPEPR